jgi:LysM repeat protein
MTNGYNFYFKDGSDVLTFPITPSDLTIKVGSKNKVVTLISEGDVNILKSPSLTEVSFEARFPMRQYPYARKFSPFENYWNKFKELKEKKKSFRFIVARTTPNGSRTWDTNLLMALEDMQIKESADEGDDVLVAFTLKQFKDYGVKKIKLPATQQPSSPTSTSTSNQNRGNDNQTKSSQKHTVKSGDTLWGIAKKYYGNGAKYPTIYQANKTVIENTAKKYGKASSSNGHWIYVGTELVIPEQ